MKIVMLVLVGRRRGVFEVVGARRGVFEVVDNVVTTSVGGTGSKVGRVNRLVAGTLVLGVRVDFDDDEPEGADVDPPVPGTDAVPVGPPVGCGARVGGAAPPAVFDVPEPPLEPESLPGPGPPVVPGMPVAWRLPVVPGLPVASRPRVPSVAPSPEAEAFASDGRLGLLSAETGDERPPSYPSRFVGVPSMAEHALMTSPATAEAATYWIARRGRRGGPLRSSIMASVPLSVRPCTRIQYMSTAPASGSGSSVEDRIRHRSSAVASATEEWTMPDVTILNAVFNHCSRSGHQFAVAAPPPRPNAAFGTMRDMVEKSLWTQKIESEPEHSHWFVQRFREMAAAGKDIAGEARLIDAMVPREALILDAGCGSGRAGGVLSRRGHTVIGIDVDPVLIEAAREDHPSGRWLVGDLAEFDLTTLGASEPFDAIVAAGNVMPFLAPSTRRPVLANLRAALAADGRMAVGFGAGRGYQFDEFFADAASTGWEIDLRMRGWNLLPFAPDSDFLVALMRPEPAGRSRHARSAARAHGRRDPGGLRGSGGSGGADPMGGHSLRPMG